VNLRPEWTLCAGAYALIAGALLAGCVSTGSDRSAFEFASASARNTQVALTSLIALDTAQTVTIARSPECLFEANPVAAAAFGSRTPDPARVLITNTLYLTGHWLLASYLDRMAEAPIDLSIPADEDIARHKRWRLLRRVYQLATAIGHGAAVINNEAKGIRPFSSFDCGTAQ
jgi:hypothetical protein